jgi:hypothetical protein
MTTPNAKWKDQPKMWATLVVSPCNLYARLYTIVLLYIDTIWEDPCTKDELLDLSLKGSLISFLQASAR